MGLVLVAARRGTPDASGWRWSPFQFVPYTISGRAEHLGFSQLVIPPCGMGSFAWGGE
jgi:hypothetical protein